MSANDTSKTPKRIEDTSKKPRKVDPNKVAKALGAEKVEGTPKVEGDPVSKAAAQRRVHQDIKTGKYDK